MGWSWKEYIAYRFCAYNQRLGRKSLVIYRLVLIFLPRHVFGVWIASSFSLNILCIHVTDLMWTLTKACSMYMYDFIHCPASTWLDDLIIARTSRSTDVTINVASKCTTLVNSTWEIDFLYFFYFFLNINFQCIFSPQMSVLVSIADKSPNIYVLHPLGKLYATCGTEREKNTINTSTITVNLLQRFIC